MSTSPLGCDLLDREHEIHLGDAEPEWGSEASAGTSRSSCLSGPHPRLSPTKTKDLRPGGVPVSLAKDVASWCHPGRMMWIHIYFSGEPTFQEQLVKGLEVRDVRLNA